MARDYSELDQPGKNVVRVVIAEEGKRVTAERERRQVAPAEPQETRYIPLYYTPAAAGLTSPAEGGGFRICRGRQRCALEYGLCCQNCRRQHGTIYPGWCYRIRQPSAYYEWRRWHLVCGWGNDLQTILQRSQRKHTSIEPEPQPKGCRPIYRGGKSRYRNCVLWPGYSAPAPNGIITVNVAPHGGGN